MRVKPVEAVLAGIGKKIKPAWKTAFFASVVIGLLTHFYAITNDLPQSDGLFAFDDASYAMEGRWFLKAANWLGSFFRLPWLDGIASVLWLALAAVVIVELFHISKTVGVVLVSAVMMTFPVVASHFSYIYCAPAYLLAMLLAVLAVYFTNRYRYGFIAGAVLLCFSLGIYQAYLACALVLVLLLLAVHILDGDSLKAVLGRAARYFAMGVIGVVAYYAVLRIVLFATGAELLGIQGLPEVESGGLSLFSLQGMGEAALRAVVSFAGTFFASGIFASLAARVAGVAYLLLLIFLLMYIVVNKRAYAAVWRIAGLVLILLAVPFAVGILFFVSAGLHFYSLMKMAYVFLFIAGIVLCERFVRGENMRQLLLQWGAVITTGVLCLCFIVTDNIAYQNMHTRYEKAYGLCLRLVDRVEMLEGFEAGMPLMVYDGGYPDVYPQQNESERYLLNLVNTERNTFLLFHSGTYINFMRVYLNVEFERLPPEAEAEIANTAEFLAMGSWPKADSVRIIDGVAVVKMRSHTEIPSSTDLGEWVYSALGWG